MTGQGWLTPSYALALLCAAHCEQDAVIQRGGDVSSVLDDDLAFTVTGADPTPARLQTCNPAAPRSPLPA